MEEKKQKSSLTKMAMIAEISKELQLSQRLVQDVLETFAKRTVNSVLRDNTEVLFSPYFKFVPKDRAAYVKKTKLGGKSLSLKVPAKRKVMLVPFCSGSSHPAVRGASGTSGQQGDQVTPPSGGDVE